MPVHLEPLDVSSDLENFRSVLIVSCPVCPPMCLAMQQNSPFIEFFKRGLKTGAFEEVDAIFYRTTNTSRPCLFKIKTFLHRWIDSIA